MSAPTIIPPNATDLEQAVLGAMMLEQRAQVTCISILQPEHFYKPAHAIIFKAIQGLYRKSQSIDILTVSEALREGRQLDNVGGSWYVSELTNQVASAANAESHARIIIQKYVARKLGEEGLKLYRNAFEDNTDVFELLDNHSATIVKLRGGLGGVQLKSISKVVADNLRQIEAVRSNDKAGTGYPTISAALTAAIFGWEKGNLYIVAGRPGMGKSAFITSEIANLAVRNNVRVGIFSLEMSASQQVMRMQSAESLIPFEKLKRATYDGSYDEANLMKGSSALSEAPIWINDKCGLNILELRSAAMQMKQEHDVEVIMVDYLQLMSGDKKSNREREISDISATLKQVARDLDVPVIALAQLSRAVETRGGDKIPQLSDLRDSGAIEQDADGVIFLYRPEYYGITQYDSGRPTNGLALAVIAKNRHGVLENIELQFIGRLFKFTDYEEKDFTPRNYSEAQNMDIPF